MVHFAIIHVKTVQVNVILMVYATTKFMIVMIRNFMGKNVTFVVTIIRKFMIIVKLAVEIIHAIHVLIQNFMAIFAIFLVLIAQEFVSLMVRV